MRILFLSDGLRRGGKERQLSYLVKGLLDLGHSVSIISFDRELHYPEFLDDRLTIHFLNPKKRKNLQAWFGIWRICRAERPHVIHAWDSISSICAWPASLLANRPLINGSLRTNYQGKKRQSRWLVQFSCLLSSIVLANSRSGLTSLSRSESKKYKVIYNGFEIPEISKFTVREKRRMSKVLMIANYTADKDYETVIKVMENVISNQQNVSFQLIGSEVKSRLEKKLPPAIKDHVLLENRVDDTSSYLSSMDIGLLSSFREGLSNAVMEYMAYGKPVVATDVGGLHELIENGREGFLTPVQDSQAMSKIILYLLQNEDEAANMGALGRDKIHRDFSMRAMIEAHIALYSELITRPENQVS